MEVSVSEIWSCSTLHYWLAKHILTSPDCFCAKILKSIYFLKGDVLDATLGSYPSQMWQALLEGRDMLTQGLIRKIGGGKFNLVVDSKLDPKRYLN